MDRTYSIAMFIVSLCLFYYALSIGLSKNIKLIPHYKKVKVKDPKKYAKDFGKFIAMIAAAPLLSGIVALFGDIEYMVGPALIVLFVGIILAFVLGIRMMSKDI
ncbi:MAG: hypothetical protein K5931_02535 [Lachnospiraceae bacterium]|nr:hypothetical protein [Lachnospiraceae bacterium]